MAGERQVWCSAALVAALLLACLTGCPNPQPEDIPEIPEEPPVAQADDDAGEVEEMAWTITSWAFEDGERIPAKYTADGEDISPPLDLGEGPEGAVELALICDDPDAPSGVWTHWVLYGLSPDVAELPEGIVPKAKVNKPACVQGLNSWPKIGYGGPAPPAGTGTHRYQFTVYALDGPVELEPGATKSELAQAMRALTIAKATFTGTYSR